MSTLLDKSVTDRLLDTGMWVHVGALHPGHPLAWSLQLRPIGPSTTSEMGEEPCITSIPSTTSEMGEELWGSSPITHCAPNIHNVTISSHT
jgi:hypothetical protein